MKKITLRKALLAFLLTPLLLPLQQANAEVKPLLLDGKQSIFQRVLSKSRASLSAKPGREDNASEITPFTVFYVYGYQKMGNNRWVQVGSDIHGKILGWVAESSLIPWNQGLTVAFRNPVGGERALLFNSKESVKKLLENENGAEVRSLYKAAVDGDSAADSPVVAIQPNFHVDLTKDFYLAPILDHEDLFYGDGEAKLLKIATASQQRELAPEPEPEPEVVVASEDPAPASAVEAPAFTSGVVFVVDTTLSMGPYIDRTREAIRKIYKNLTATEDTGKVRFGLVGYRDQSAGEVDLGYLSKTFATLEQGAEEAAFFNAVNDVAPATVSSVDFREDTYAGVKTALDEIDWKSVDARYIVLITDAGPRSAGDERSSTQLDYSTLHELTQQKNIAVTSLHLLTPQGINDHASAAEAYEKLSLFPGVGSLYFGVEAGDVDAFGGVIDTLTQQISVQVKTAAKSFQEQNPIVVADVVPEVKAPEPEKPEKTENTVQLQEVQQKFARLGNALRMQYLQKDNDTAVPDVFNAWILDRSLTDPKKKMLDVGVLLTRDQLGEMHTALNNAMETFEDGLIEPRGFLEDIKKLAATISRDPEGLKDRNNGFDLGSMGWMQEYIEDLPYQSQALSISLDDWESWSVKRQLGFIHRLQEKIAYYQAVYDHTDMWFSPAGGSVDGDSVIALSLDMLP